MISLTINNIDHSRKAIILWLLSGCFLIFLMVMIGGITRLTGSGLSITEWNVIMGTLPPMNQQDWQIVFEKYQLSPQFQKINYDMGMMEFKSIFIWEYLHRLIGRIIGLVFLIPFIYFLITKKIDKILIGKLLLLFSLGGLQGFLGWFMVKSGLIDNPHVSHYRLAIHLITAFLTFGFTFWIALELIYQKLPHSNSTPQWIRKTVKAIMLLLILQIIYGAFVAGLHAGRVYNTFPKMGDEWIAKGVYALSPFWKNFTENLAGVQFIHRSIAWLLIISIFLLWFFSRNTVLTASQKKGINILALFVLFQFILGVFTLLYAAPITLSVLHQAGAFVLFAATVFLSHRLT